jgi:hypothetical protein
MFFHTLSLLIMFKNSLKFSSVYINVVIDVAADQLSRQGTPALRQSTAHTRMEWRPQVFIQLLKA